MKTEKEIILAKEKAIELEAKQHDFSEPFKNGWRMGYARALLWVLSKSEGE